MSLHLFMLIIFRAFWEPVFLLLVYPSVVCTVLLRLSDVMRNIRGVNQFPAFSVCTINQVGHQAQRNTHKNV